MACRRCSLCNINYPIGFLYCQVMACRSTLWYIENEDPADTWHEQVRSESGGAGMGDSAVNLARLYPHPPDARVSVMTINGKQYVTHQALLDVGYSNVEAFTVVFVNAKFYELQGRANRSYWLTGKYSEAGLWWIEEVPLELPLPVIADCDRSPELPSGP